MRPQTVALALLPLALAACPKPEAPQALAYPDAHRGEVVDTFYGTEVADPYRWLEDPDAEDTQAWVASQNALFESWIADVPARATLRARLEELWNHERFSTPSRYGERTVYWRNDGLQDQSVLYVLDGEGADPRVLLDPNTLSEDGTVAISGTAVTEDGALLAWGASDGGSDWVTWRVRDVTTGEDLDDVIAWTKFTGVSWLPDNTGFLYSRYPEPTNPLEQVNHFQEVYLHTLGSPQADDVLIHQNPDEPEWGFNAEVTEDGEWVFLTTWRSTEEKNLVWYRPLAGLTGDSEGEDAGWRPLVDDWEAEYVPLGTLNGRVWLKTTLDAPRGRVVAVDLADPARDAWVDVVPQLDDVIEGASLVGHRLILTTMHDAHSRVLVYDLDGAPEGEVELPGVGSATGFDGHIDDAETYYAFEGFTTPDTIYRYDVEAGTSEVFRQPEVAFDPSAYTTEQVFYESADGTRVPMFLVHRADLELDGTAPALLYGYGGFNIPLTPWFSMRTIPWLELGGVYAVANLRGGGEYGQEWHLAGTQLHKQNVFDDAHAAAEWLIANGYTSSDRLAIQGGSNGGLLVGAAVTQRPDLYAAGLPAVGVLDMLRYHLFTIGWAWASDYGTVDDSEEMFRALLAYSPYHQALRTPGEYPALLITTGDHDDRVVPAHSFKFTAAMQAAQQGTAPILARIETRAGHGSGKPTSMRLDEYADQLAFLVKVLGIETSSGE